MTDVTYERVQTALNRLKLTRMPDALDRLAEDAGRAKAS